MTRDGLMCMLVKLSSALVRGMIIEFKLPSYQLLYHQKPLEERRSAWNYCIVSMVFMPMWVQFQPFIGSRTERAR